MIAKRNKVDFGAFIAKLKESQVKDPQGFENELKTYVNDINELFRCYFVLDNNKAAELIDLRISVKDEGRFCWAYFAIFRLNSSSGKYEFQRLVKCDRYSVNSEAWDIEGFFETMRYKKRVQSLNGKGDYYRFISAYCLLLKQGDLKPKYADFESVEFKE